MARSATPPGRPGRPGRRAPVPQGRSSLLPVLLAGGAVLVAIIFFALNMGTQDENLPAETDRPDVPAATKPDASATKPAPEKPTPPAGPNWKQLRAQVDMTMWREIESQMAQAMRLRSEALAARAESEERFASLMTEAVKTWRKADQQTEDFIYVVNQVHPQLYNEGFDREANQIQSWTKAFRGYLGFEK